MKKRILSMLLAIVMVVGMLPSFTLTALAADTTTETKTVYMVNSKNWTNLHAHAWLTGVSGTTWPGTPMTKTTDTIHGFDVYSVTVSAEYTGIIFNNGDNGRQTSDLSLEAGKYYDLLTAAWYDSLSDIPVPDPLATGVYLAGSFNGWSTSANEFRRTSADDDQPSVTMTLEANTSYEFKVVDNNQWLSHGNTITESTNVSTYDPISSGGNNMKLVTSVAGSYVFSFTTIDGAPYIRIQYPASDTTAPELTAGTVERTSDTAATVTFDSSEAGTFYYAVVDSGATAPNIDTSGTGFTCAAGDNTISLTDLTAGTKVIYIVAKDDYDNVSEMLHISISAYVLPTPATYTITIADTTNGTVTADKNSASADETVTLTVTPDEGYELDSLTVTGADGTNVSLSGEGNTRTFTMPASNVTVETTFKAIPITNAAEPTINTQPVGASYTVDGTPVALTVTASVTDGGSLSYQWYSNTTNSTTGGTAISGATNASYMPPTGAEGMTYYYCVVTNTNESVNGEKTASVISNVAAIEVTALTYTVTATAEPAAGGTITGSGSYKAGNYATVKATANDGYTFVKWTKNDAEVSTEAEYKFTVNENITLIAVFEEVVEPTRYTVNVSAEPQAGGTVAGGGSYEAGADATVKATANDGYTFVKWTENGSEVSTSADYTFTADKDRNLVANFEAGHYHPICGASCTHTGSDAHNNAQWTAWESAYKLPTEAGNYYLTQNVYLGNNEWTVPTGETKLCLNGMTINIRSIIIGSGNTLSITDCGNGMIDGSGTTMNNNSKSLIKNSGTLNLYGGSIASTSSYGKGAGVLNENSSTFNMYGGMITECSSNGAGSSVYNSSGCTFNMFGGSITKNGYYDSIGANVHNEGKFNMYGGSITDNKGSYGVYTANNFSVSGTVVISGNKHNGKEANVFLCADGVRIVVVNLGADSRIGVTRYQKVGTITTGGDEYIDCFFSDDPQYIVEQEGDNLKLSEKYFTVTVTVNKAEYGTASADCTSGTMGKFVTLTATPADGYRLKEWQVITGGVTVSPYNTFYIGTENVEIQAIFEEIPPHTHTWEYSVNGENDTITATCKNTDEGCDNPDGGSVSIAAPDSTEYTGSAVEAKVTDTLTTDDTVTLVYAAAENSALTNDKPVKIGTYTATITVGGAEVSVNYTITHAEHDYDENTHRCACGDIEQFTITFIVDREEYATITQDYGTEITAPADPTKVGYTFGGWNTNIPATMPAENMTITALFEANTYKINYLGLEDGRINGDYPTEYTYGIGASLPVDVTREGYTFKGWYTELTGGIGPIESVGEQATSDKSYYAQWTVNSYTITFIVDGETYTTFTQDYGTAITAPADPTKVGYTFGGWDKEIPQAMPAENITITARWDVNEYTITFVTNDGTSVDPITQDYGTDVAKPDDPTKTGFDFGDWYTDAELTTAYVFGTMPAENITLYAKWNPATGTAYTVKHYHENISGDGYTLYATETLRGTTNTDTAAVAKNYPGFTALVFAQTTILADGSAIVEIKYDRNTYAVDLVTNGGTIRDGNVTEYTYGVGAKLPINVTRSGYIFRGWYDNEACTGTPVTEITKTDIGDKIFYAKWDVDITPFLPLLIKYDIDVADGIIGGTVTTDKSSASVNDKVNVTVVPAEGYTIQTVIVTDAKGNTVTVNVNGEGKYSFKMPMRDVTVYAVFDKTEVPVTPTTCPRDYTCPMYPFTDLELGAWYHDGVHFAIENGLMGSTNTDKLTFEPNATTTRAMIVTILWRLEGSPVVNYAMDFEDVAADTWYTEAIRWAASEKIVEGYGDTFGPSDAITREQLATIMWRYAKHKGYDVSVGENTNILSYGDAFDVAEWAIPAMQWACGSGMIQGIADGNTMNLEPQGKATRAQAATILYRFCEIVVES